MNFKPQLLELEPRVVPTISPQQLDTMYWANQSWTSMVGPNQQPMPPMDVEPAFCAMAQQWAADAAGHGGDGRDLGPQTDSVYGWETSNTIIFNQGGVESAGAALAGAYNLIHSNNTLTMGIGVDGDYYCIIQGFQYPPQQGSGMQGVFPTPGDPWTDGRML